MKRTYENQQIRVFWDADKCTHSTNCLRGLPSVFNRQKRPWVDINGAKAEEIQKCIDKCPSGALSYEMLRESSNPKNNR